MSSETAWNKGQLFSSKNHDWETPKDLFSEVNREFNFDLDAAASAENAKVDSFLTIEDDSLSVDWSLKGRVIWLNPPYGRGIGQWIKKAYCESVKGCTVVVLTMVRSDTKWWCEWAMRAAEIRLIEGRVHFRRGEETGGAPAPSALLVFDENRRIPQFKQVKLPRGTTK